ncbi:MAG: response regulator [bacterium]|nr:response regulator [bacterium]
MWRFIHLTARTDIRRWSIAGSQFERDRFTASVGLTFSPGERPLSLFSGRFIAMDPRRVLLVDAELALLRLMEKYLTRRGHHVRSCQRGQEAWEQFQKPGERFDLAIVDLSLADIPGATLLERMLETDPGLRALVCSGTPDSGSLSANPRVGYLQKPFLPEALAHAVDAALGRGEAAQES